MVKVYINGKLMDVSDTYLSVMGTMSTIMGTMEGRVPSVPPIGANYKKVTNIYVEIVEGVPKLRVEYET